MKRDLVINNTGGGTLSIIIPVYNSEKYLGYCLNSIFNQNYADIEVLLIDDGSTDGSAHICQEYVERDNRFKYYKKENGGVASARNFGLSIAMGDYIAFVDNDDIVAPDMYAVLIELINKYQCDCSACQFIKKYDGYNIDFEQKVLDENKILMLNGNIEILECVTRHNDSIEGMIWNKVYRKQAIGNLLFDTNVQLVDDAVFSVNLFSKCNKVCFYRETMYYWMQHGNNQTVTASPEKCISAAVGFHSLLPVAKDVSESCYYRIMSEFVNWSFTAIERSYKLDKSEYSNEISHLNTTIRQYKKLFKHLDFKPRIKSYVILYFPVAFKLLAKIK